MLRSLVKAALVLTVCSTAGMARALPSFITHAEFSPTRLSHTVSLFSPVRALISERLEVLRLCRDVDGAVRSLRIGGKPVAVKAVDERCVETELLVLHTGDEFFVDYVDGDSVTDYPQIFSAKAGAEYVRNMGPEFAAFSGGHKKVVVNYFQPRLIGPAFGPYVCMSGIAMDEVAALTLIRAGSAAMPLTFSNYGFAQGHCLQVRLLDPYGLATLSVLFKDGDGASVTMDLKH